jgi:hypothetical protein
MAAMNGVQAPGNMAMSEIMIIEAPVTNPAIGPNTNPLTKVSVSVNPILIKMP